MYLVHPVLHELWMGAKGEREIAHLNRFGKAFVRLDRLIQPTPATQILIGRLCNKCRKVGILDPKHPKHYHDICIAVLTRQIGATLVTEDISDFKRIKKSLVSASEHPAECFLFSHRRLPRIAVLRAWTSRRCRSIAFGMPCGVKISIFPILN